MSILMTIVVAIRALKRNVMRTTLTTLGLVIGVSAVIIMVAIGTGAQMSIESSIRSTGTNVVYVNAGSGGFGPVRSGAGSRTSLLPSDATAIRNEVPGIRYVSPGVNTGAQIISDRSNWGTQIQGASQDLLAIRSWAIEFGSFFGEHEVRTAAKVVVLGSVARDELFGPGIDPVGSLIRIRNQPFRVIGVLTKKGQVGFGGDQDDVVVVPYTTVQKKLLGIVHVQNIMLSAEDDVSLDFVQADVTQLLRIRHNIIGDDDDFMIRTQDEMSNLLTGTMGTLTTLLGGIAGVSLLVGGIGIMNIMLVSVTERTREIGLRLAVGARDIDVLLQFLVEAVVLSLAGGAIGIAVGMSAAYGITQMTSLATEVSLNSVLLAFGFSAAIGIFFGFYPARKAAKLDPIDALRFE